MSMHGTFRRQRGFTLVEVSILLTVVVILSAVIAPVLSRSVADTRLSAARAELTAIATALRSFLEDIGCEIVPQHLAYDSGYRRSDVARAPIIVPPKAPPTGGGDERGRFIASAHASTPCSTGNMCNAPPVELLVSSGDVPSVGPEGDWEWAEFVNGENVDYLEYYLISNTPGRDAGRAFPTPDDCADPVSRRFASVRAWRGAYLSVGDGDPWGNRYMVNTYFLAESFTEDVVVLSAGPDQEIDSQFAVDGFVPGDDDVVVLFSAGH